MKRRGFLGALLAAPVMAKAAPLLSAPVAEVSTPKAVTVSKLVSGDLIIRGTITSRYLTIDSVDSVAVNKIHSEDAA